MSLALNERQRDRLLAVAALVFAGSLVAGARALEDSLLSDAVGAGGVPQGVGAAMALAAVVLFAKSFFGPGKPRAAADAGAGAGASAGSSVGSKAGPHASVDTGASVNATPSVAAPGSGAHGWAAAARTAGLVAILVGYGLLLPWLGYAISVGLLVLASGWLAGAALRAPLLLCALAAGPLLWAIFDWALRVRMPVGSLWT
jgi:putative tricarboxylic transport membrane protein